MLKFSEFFPVPQNSTKFSPAPVPRRALLATPHWGPFLVIALWTPCPHLQVFLKHLATAMMAHIKQILFIRFQRYLTSSIGPSFLLANGIQQIFTHVSPDKRFHSDHHPEWLHIAMFPKTACSVLSCIILWTQVRSSKPSEFRSPSRFGLDLGS